MFQALCQQYYKDQFSYNTTTEQVRYFYPHFTDEENHMGRMNYPVQGYKAKSRDPNRLKIYIDTHLVIYVFANFIYIHTSICKLYPLNVVTFINALFIIYLFRKS